MTKRCIFCKKNSADSRSVEHLLPESLGNKDHILPAGVVCDSCNNYFASSVEQPVLESKLFLTARFNALIPNKREKMSSLRAVLLPVTQRGGELYAYEAEVTRGTSGGFYVNVEPAVEDGITSGEITRLVIPTSGQRPERHVFARFLAKVAVECMAADAGQCPRTAARIC